MDRNKKFADWHVGQTAHLLPPGVPASLTSESFPDAGGGPGPSLSLEALGMPLKDRLDRHCRLAAEVLEASAALITRVSADGQCVVASVGLASSQTGWAGPLAAQASSYRLLEVPDMRRDARCALNPLVTEPPRLRFFAGTELCGLEGRAPLGALCVMDSSPGRLTEAQCRLFLRLADLVEQDLLLEEQLSRVPNAGVPVRATDPKTNLSASFSVEDYVGSLLRQAQGGGRGLAAVAVNVSGLDQLTRVFGEEAGEALIRGVESRLRAEVPAGAEVIPLKESWVVVLLRVDAATEDFIGLVQSLAEVLTPAYDLELIGSVHAAFRLGVATAFPGDPVGPGELLARACRTALQVTENGGFGFYASVN